MVFLDCVAYCRHLTGNGPRKWSRLPRDVQNLVALRGFPRQSADYLNNEYVVQQALPWPVHDANSEHELRLRGDAAKRQYTSRGEQEQP
jgi:hypothetical protein